MKISLSIWNIRSITSLSLDDIANTATLNGKNIELNIPEFASKLLTIVSSWDSEMINHNILDGVEYRLKIEKDNKIYQYIGRNKFPNNFHDFLKLLTDYNIIK